MRFKKSVRSICTVMTGLAMALSSFWASADVVGNAVLNEFKISNCGKKICVVMFGPEAFMTPNLNYYAAENVRLQILNKKTKKEMGNYFCRSFSYEAVTGYILCSLESTGKIKHVSVDLTNSKVTKSKF